MTNTIPNVPRELLAELQEHIDCHRDAVLWGKVCDLLSAPSPANHVEDVRAMVAAPSPAGVDGLDGLEVIGWYTEDHLDDKSATTYSWTVAERWVEKGWPVSPLYAAPVSEAKARGVVLTDEELCSIRNQVACNEVRRDDDSRTICVKHGRALEAAVLARITAAPVQQVSVPGGPNYKRKFEALVDHCKLQDKEIADLRYDANIRRFYDDSEVWFWACDETDNLETLACPVVINAGDLRAMLAAAPAAPAADAWIPVSERLPDIAQEVIVHSEFDGVCAGVLDSYGEWFAPCSEYKLIRVTSWMPMPTKIEANRHD